MNVPIFHICPSTSACVFVHTYVFVIAFACIAYFHVCLHACLCVLACMHLCLCTCVCLGIYVCVHVSTCLCVCVLAYVCLHLCSCMCVHLCCDSACGLPLPGVCSCVILYELCIRVCVCVCVCAGLEIMFSNQMLSD